MAGAWDAILLSQYRRIFPLDAFLMFFWCGSIARYYLNVMNIQRVRFTLIHSVMLFKVLFPVLTVKVKQRKDLWMWMLFNILLTSKSFFIYFIVTLYFIWNYDLRWIDYTRASTVYILDWKRTLSNDGYVELIEFINYTIFNFHYYWVQIVKREVWYTVHEGNKNINRRIHSIAVIVRISLGQCPKDPIK